jgi:hypothetical protein
MASVKRLRRVAFNGSAALSLLLCVALVVMWFRSFRSDARLVGVSTASGRYTIKSSFGRIVLAGPKKTGRAAGVHDSTFRELAAQACNDDITWNLPARRGYIEGVVRPGSATARMYDRVRLLLGDPADLAWAERTWLATLDDPRRFLPAHLMLLLRARGVGETRVRLGEWPGWMLERRDEANAEGETPVLYVPANAAGDGPDLSRQAVARDEWHDPCGQRPTAARSAGWCRRRGAFPTANSEVTA